MKQQLLRSLIMTIGLFVPLGMVNGDRAQAFDLGGASDFNLYLSGDLKQASSDIEGRAAIGGNTDLNHYSVGIKRSGEEVLRVGGNLTFPSGTIAGNATVGGNYSGGATAQSGSSLTSNAGLTNFFQTTTHYLNNYSSSLGSLTNTGSNALLYTNNLIFTGNSAASRNVFTVDGAVLAKAAVIKFETIGNSEVLVNVTGNSVTLPNAGFNGIAGLGSNSRLFFNFPSTTEIAMVGSFGANTDRVNILAPQATIRSNWGQINGQVLAKDLVNFQVINGQTVDLGSVQVNDPGNLGPGSGQNPTTVPTPALLPGLIGFGLQTWRKRRQVAVESAQP
jgi:choice-of-anchor A domain-containing protein